MPALRQSLFRIRQALNGLTDQSREHMTFAITRTVWGILIMRASALLILRKRQDQNE